ncbi:MAG TPA: ABC transporter transmembrane domain-containing protein [Verrucomicrobiae bacterium]|nr:ABC transporter transmembrane domain-containing protein [Verrucomicrobiae bacterium]
MARRPIGSTARPAEDRAISRDLWLLADLWPFVKPYRWRLAAAVTAAGVAAIMVLALGRGIGALIDSGFGTGNAELLDQALLIIIAGTAVLVAATFVRVSLLAAVGEQVVADIRRHLYRHIIGLSPAFYESTRTGEVLSRLTVDATLLQAVVATSVSVSLRNLLLFVGGAAMMLITSPKLTGLAFLVVPLVVLPIIVFGRRVRRLSRKTQDRIADVSAYAEESLHAVRTVQAFTHEAVDRQLLGARIDAGLAAAFGYIRSRALLVAIVMLLVFGAITFVLWIGGHDVLAGRLTGGELSAFIIYAAFVAGSIGAIAEVFGDLQRAAGAMERLAEILNTPPLIAAPENPRPLPKPAAGAVAFHDVTFHYPTRPETAALAHFTLDVRAGEKVAIVGPSGAGKTTVFQLLLRFYDPQSGSITLDGVELRAADPADIRARIGLVPQEPVIFAASALENIRYGRPAADDAAVRAAADAAYATEFLDRQPQGFATPLGERGVRLSGGQRQRIALARAILRDPALLLLDEATSALDAESERMVQQALDRLMVGRTTLIIAHRLATVLKADRIVVMDHGRIVEEGTHADLVRKGGLYARLAALQFEQTPDLDADRSLRQIAE